MSSIPLNPSESTKRRNPALYGGLGHQNAPQQVLERQARRIKQDHKPLMNKLEAEYLRILQARYPAAKILAQAVTVKLGNGCRFCPDLFSFNFKQAWEIKGRYAWDDSIVKLKVAATMLPEITWVLCWKQDGRWQEQIVLP